MLFKRISPAPSLEKIIECYWIAEEDQKLPKQTKVIPDGFTEIIIHFGDPFRIRMEECWQGQTKYLLAGQVNKHFWLENTGSSSMIGIKLQPAALTHLYNLHMTRFTNRVVNLLSVRSEWNVIINKLNASPGYEEKISLLNEFFNELLSKNNLIEGPVDLAVDIIHKNHGMVSIANLSDQVEIGERQLENLFKRYIGLTPKSFARIKRFNYIFQLLKIHEGWCDIAYEAAFYDQSHFIRNFKNFTGENPTDYAFEENNMANFFLKRSD